MQCTYPNALFDKVVLIPFELRGQAMSFIPVRCLDTFQPCVIKLGLRLVGGGDTQAVNSFAISLRITAPLGLGNGCFQSIDTQRNRAATNEKEAIEPCPTWIALADNMKNTFVSYLPL